jgi:hypothetical protein
VVLRYSDGPWTYFAAKERENYASTIWATAAQVGYMVMIAMILAANPSLADVAIGFALVMAAALVVQFVLLGASAWKSRAAS